MKHFLMTLSAIALTAGSAQAAGISKQEVLEAQKTWGEGIVAIGKIYQEKGDYKARATQHIKELYAYDQGEVLFKPTLASDDQFRETFNQALSYFVKGDISEDSGFAIKPWSNVRWGEQQIITDSDSAVAMGNYFFHPCGQQRRNQSRIHVWLHERRRWQCAH